MAYYVSDEGTYNGANFSKDSVRYSYDVVDETGDGYEERNQVNLRAIYTIKGDNGSTACRGGPWNTASWTATAPRMTEIIMRLPAMQYANMRT